MTTMMMMILESLSHSQLGMSYGNCSVYVCQAVESEKLFRHVIHRFHFILLSPLEPEINIFFAIALNREFFNFNFFMSSKKFIFMSSTYI